MAPGSTALACIQIAPSGCRSLPHVVETWKLTTDPEFIAKVRDVAGLG